MFNFVINIWALEDSLFSAKFAKLRRVEYKISGNPLPHGRGDSTYSKKWE